MIGIFLRGLLMGAADIVPGVSGGTMAFITGIYDRLITGISDLSVAGKHFFSGEFKKAVKTVDFSLFLPLGIGIVLAFLLGSAVIPGLIEAYPAYVYSFFFGLILASAYIVYMHIKNHNVRHVFTHSLPGFVVAVVVASLSVTQTEPTLFLVFLGGLIAICAMLLPGVSGSYILLILGLYEFILTSIHDRNLLVIGVFGVGALIGLLGFSRILKHFLHKYHNETFYVLGGIMLGGLTYPFREVMAVGTSSMAPGIIGLLIIGGALVLVVEKIAYRKS